MHYLPDTLYMGSYKSLDNIHLLHFLFWFQTDRGRYKWTEYLTCSNLNLHIAADIATLVGLKITVLVMSLLNITEFAKLVDGESYFILGLCQLQCYINN